MEEGRFPNKLRKFRRMAGLSQKKVARLLGFADASVISRWECGAALPNLLYVFKLAILYHAFVHELYEYQWETSKLSFGITSEYSNDTEEVL